MIAGSVDEPGASGGPRIEVRWIVPGPPPAGVIEWFERLPTGSEVREDSYLVAPRLPGLALKIRGGLALDVKLFRGGCGILTVPGIGAGYLGCWSKWSFPFGATIRPPDDASSWRQVKKHRRLSTFLPDDGRMIAGLLASHEGRMCTAELSEVTVGEGRWWTFALEAAGPTDRLRQAIEAAAARFLTDAPGDLRLDLEHSRSYADWLEAHP